MVVLDLAVAAERSPAPRVAPHEAPRTQVDRAATVLAHALRLVIRERVSARGANRFPSPHAHRTHEGLRQLRQRRWRYRDSASVKCINLEKDVE